MAQAPKERARPVDQGEAGICSLAAVGNAIVDGAMDGGKDFKLDEVIGALKQLDFVHEKDGNYVNEFDGSALKRITDSETGMAYDVMITIRHGDVKNSEDLRQIRDKRIRCVLDYNRHGGERHAVFIDSLIEIRGIPNFVCINSWGTFDQNPNIEVGRNGNKIFEVKATYTRLDCGDEDADCSVDIDTNFDESEDDMRRGTYQIQAGTFKLTHAKIAWATWATYVILHLNAVFNPSLRRKFGDLGNFGREHFIVVFLFSITVKYTLESKLIFKQGETCTKWIAQLDIFWISFLIAQLLMQQLSYFYFGFS